MLLGSSVSRSVADGRPLYIFPRSPIESFEFLHNEKHMFYPEPTDEEYIRIRTVDRLIEFKNSDTAEVPRIPFYNTNLEHERFKERDFCIYDNENKYITVCHLREKRQGYYFYSKQNDNSYYEDLYLRLFVESDKPDINIRFKFNNAYVAGDINYNRADEYYRFKIEIVIEGGETANVGTTDDEDKEYTFQVVAQVISRKHKEEGELLQEKQLTMKYSPYQGWTLTKKGKLKQGRTGWLIDENGLFILKDGRRHLTEGMGIRIGNEDAKLGLNEIMESIPQSIMFSARKPDYQGGININKIPPYIPTKPIKNEYGVYEELLKEQYTAMTNLVVMQAFQISACYNNANPLILSDNVRFYSIGLDETDIPIVVTEIKGPEGQISENIHYHFQAQAHAANLKKLVIAGPHGDERNAQLAVLETQKYFMRNSVSVYDLMLYFVPSISPTMFFADARGLPFDGIVRYADNMTDAEKEKIAKTAADTALAGLTIPLLHGRIASKRALIQGQTNSLEPANGIDTNRDVYNLLKSTNAFYNFVIGEANGNRSNNFITLFMMHGYEDASGRDIRDKISTTSAQGTLSGPYLFDRNNGYIEDHIMDQMDIITTLIFGYRYERGKNITNKVEYSGNYFFNKKTNIKDEFNGEWSRKFYLREGNENAPSIQCFDIELGQDYNEGYRERIPIYDDTKVTNRSSNADIPFFNQDSDMNTKFVITNRSVELIVDETVSPHITVSQPVTVSFREFLLKYYDYRYRKIEKIVK
jgi:hypothetical protein